MFVFTRIVLIQTDSGIRHPMIHVAFNKRHVMYSVKRNRIVSPVHHYRDDAVLPQTEFSIDFVHSVLGTEGFVLSAHPDDATVRMTYAEACRFSSDRYDMQQMMRTLLKPTNTDNQSFSVRSAMNTRVNNIVDAYVHRVNSEYYTPPTAVATYKGAMFSKMTPLKRMRSDFHAFGAMVAHVKAGGSDHDCEDITDKFMSLANSYTDGAASAVAMAFGAAENVCDGDFEVTHCQCGHYEYNHSTHDVRNDTWCEQCFTDDAVYVEDQNEYWARDDAYYSDNDDCYYSYDRDNEYESDDDDDDSDQSIMSYSTNILNVLDANSGIKSSHFGEFTMGIELEMSSGDNHCESSADDVRSRLGSDYCIIKHDGSLPHNGFEVVTMPHGLTTHISKFKAWEIDSAYRAWNTGKCGMHVHIDSRAFTQMTLGKFLMFINSSANMDFVRKIAGRHPLVDDQARSYCAAEHQSVLTNPKQAVKGKSGERYRMVNMQNLGAREATRLGLSMDNSYNGKYNTVELRIFRASLKKERLLAQIEFTHASVMFCRVASWRDLNGTSFVKWLKTVAGQYPALVKWYGVRAVHTSQATVIAPAEVTCSDAVPPAPWTPDALTQRHDHHYPFDIPYDTEHATLRQWTQRYHLTYRFATYAGAEYMYFPYGDSSDRICDGDVVYQRVADQWVLQGESYAGILADCSYTATA
jgi:hypothetical protein